MENNNNVPIVIPEEWQKLPFNEIQGIVLVIGATDVGKSTFAKFLYNRLGRDNKKVAYLDGDPGQSTLGPPSTMNLAISAKNGCDFPPIGQDWSMFIGSVTPRGHMLPILVGASQLVNAAHNNEVDTIVYDTSGLVDPQQGGIALKQAKINLLKPRFIIVIQRNSELQYLLSAFERSRRAKIIYINTTSNVRLRDAETRRYYRRRKFKNYFEGSSHITIGWNEFPVFPYPKYILNRLVALENNEGFTLALAIIRHIDRVSKKIALMTPIKSLDAVNSIQMGDTLIDSGTFQDNRLEINKWNSTI